MRVGIISIQVRAAAQRALHTALRAMRRHVGLQLMLLELQAAAQKAGNQSRPLRSPRRGFRLAPSTSTTLRCWRRRPSALRQRPRRATGHTARSAHASGQAGGPTATAAGAANSAWPTASAAGVRPSASAWAANATRATTTITSEAAGPAAEAAGATAAGAEDWPRRRPAAAAARGRLHHWRPHGWRPHGWGRHAAGGSPRS